MRLKDAVAVCNKQVVHYTAAVRNVKECLTKMVKLKPEKVGKSGLDTKEFITHIQLQMDDEHLHPAILAGLHSKAQAVAKAFRHKAVWQCSHDFKDWVKAAVEKGAGAAHKHSRKPQQPEPLKEFIMAGDAFAEGPQKAAELRADKWDARWQRDLCCWGDTIEALKALREDALHEPFDEPIGGPMVHGATAVFREGAGLGADQFSPGQLKAIGEDGEQGLAEVLNSIEIKLVLPGRLLEIWVALLAKQPQPGGERPIALEPMPLRCWSVIRKPKGQEWCQRMAQKWDTAVKGSSALRAALFRAVQDEIAFCSGMAVVAFYADIEKFYDNITIAFLIVSARYRHFPLRMLTVIIQLCLAPRWIRANQAYAKVNNPTCSLLAGDGEANNLARCALYTVLEATLVAAPAIKPSVFVDDTVIRLHLPRGYCTLVGVPAISKFVDELRANRFKLATKSRLVVWPAHEGVSMRDALMENGILITLAKDTKDVGVDAAMAGTRTTKVQDKRIDGMASRAIRLRKFGKVAGPKLFNAGPMEAGCFGTEATGMAPSKIRKFRRLAAQAACNLRRGASSSAVLLLCYWMTEPGYKVLKRTIHEYVVLAQTHPEIQQQLLALWLMKRDSINKLLAGVRWLKGAKGAISNFICTLKDHGWSPINPKCWRAPSGALWRIPDQEIQDFEPLNKEMWEGVESNLWKQVATHLDLPSLNLGGNLKVARGLLRYYRRHHLPGHAELLIQLVSGAYWTGERKFELGLAASPACDRCGAPVDNKRHMFFDCRCNSTIEHHLPKALVRMARQQVDDGINTCLWFHGIQPAKWDHWDEDQIIPEPGRPQAVGRAIGLAGSRLQVKELFTDGSLNSPDPRCAMAGWAFAQLGDDDQLEAGFFGPCGPDTNSSTQAEMVAIAEVLERCTGNVVIWCDNKPTVDGLMKENTPGLKASTAISGPGSAQRSTPTWAPSQLIIVTHTRDTIPSRKPLSRRGY